MKPCILVLAALSATIAYAQGSSDDVQGIPPDAAGGTLMRGVAAGNLPGHARTQASGANNLIDHGGRILPTSTIYYFWWGNLGSWPADAQTGLDAFASGLNGSSFLSSNDIFTQYMRSGSTASTAYATSFDDSSTPPSHGPSTSTIVKEACKIITAHSLQADPTAVYVVLTSNFPHGANYCAWHSWGTCNGQTIQVAYMPNTTGVAGCDPGNQYSCNAYSQGIRSIANVLSHEFSEAITDANGNAWYDSSGSEIGDKCAWQFQACVTLGVKSWQLQTEWSNAVSGCVQQ